MRLRYQALNDTLEQAGYSTFLSNHNALVVRKNKHDTILPNLEWECIDEFLNDLLEHPLYTNEYFNWVRELHSIIKALVRRLRISEALCY
jgi:endo-1,4-beta-mannosidase